MDPERSICLIGHIIAWVNDALYSWVLVFLLVAGGLYFSFKSRFVQFRLFLEQLRAVMEKPGDNKGVSSFQALMVSTASRVGTGNIIGVSTALCLGGYGSVFWMWVIALLGSATAFVEGTLAQVYKKKGPEGSYGGPAYYIEAAMGKRWLAVLFSVFLIATYGVGFNMLTSYNLQSTFAAYSFYDADSSPWIIGAVVAVTVGFCLFGGGKRIIRAATAIVPVMGICYILVALGVTVWNISALPQILGRVFSEAFDLRSIFGGFSGSGLMYGIKRGLFSNEAGVGSAPNASAAAEVGHPVKQGLVQVLSVFLDTILVCSATAFLCLSSGVEPSEGLSGAPYIQAAARAALGDLGPVFITVSMVLFAFTTFLGNLFYVDKSIAYILGRYPGKGVLWAYYLTASAVIALGAGLDADFLWNAADLTMGGMILINMPVIGYLSRCAFACLEDYQKQCSAGREPRFRAADIGGPDDTDYWK